MKLFEARRLSAVLVCKLILAYLGEKVVGKKLLNGQQEIIAYFNHLYRLDLYHVSDEGRFYKVRSRKYGFFLLRKPPSSDYKVYQQVFVDEEYALLAEMVRRNSDQRNINMLDGGANIGLVTLYLNNEVKGHNTLKSILVEPSNDNIQSASLNCGLQHMDLAFFEEAGLYNKSCFLAIENNFRDGMEWSIQVVESEKPTELRAMQIVEIMEKYEIAEWDILKLDIEGAEKYLFARDDYAGEFLQKTKMIAIEIHPEYISESAIVRILEKNGFTISRHGELLIGKRQDLVNPTQRIIFN